MSLFPFISMDNQEYTVSKNISNMKLNYMIYINKMAYNIHQNSDKGRQMLQRNSWDND